LVVIWHKSFGGAGLKRSLFFHRIRPERIRLRVVAAPFLLFLLLASTATSSHAREKDALQYGEGLIVNVPLPEPEVAQAVEDVAQNTIIRGTKEYNKDEYIAGAVAATSTPVFPPWTEGGKVFYKVRKQALDPRNFKQSADVGTLAVRYVVQPQGDQNTVLRIDALFVEDFRHTVHLSNGSVETSEYKDIQDKLAAVELVKKETAQALQAKHEQLSKQKIGTTADTVLLSTPTPTANSSENATADVVSASPISSTSQPAQAYDDSPESLAQHVAELRQQVERLVRKPGAALKSAPFHTASTLKSLEPGAEVLILISTPYWFGVETHDGEHGWIRRDQLEQVP